MGGVFREDVLGEYEGGGLAGGGGSGVGFIRGQPGGVVRVAMSRILS